MSGLFAADGSWNVTVVSGSTFTGLYAPDGSINVVHDTTYYGIYHPCGAFRVTLTATAVNSLYAPDGSWYVSVSPFVNAAQKVTIVSGAFGPFLLLADGTSKLLLQNGVDHLLITGVNPAGSFVPTYYFLGF